MKREDKAASWEHFWTSGKVEDYLAYCRNKEEHTDREEVAGASMEEKSEGTLGKWENPFL